jgi:magnesium transporter
MLYLTRMVGRPVVDSTGTQIGTMRDLGIATGEVFPRVTALAFSGPDKTPFMLSWRKYVESVDADKVVLNTTRDELRFSYQQPDEVLLARDLLNQQIVDTQGMKVVRVNDLKLAESRSQLRLLGADVGATGMLRALSPTLEHWVVGVSRAIGRPLREDLIAWNYMDLLDRDLAQVRLSVTHKRLHELHPADAADILEQLTPAQRAKVFATLDVTQAADTISEMEDDLQAEVVDDLGDERASDILELMDPDDAADILGDLPYAKAEALLRLMGVKEQAEIRGLLGYKEKTAGGIMTSEVTTVRPDMNVGGVIDFLRGEAAEYEHIFYVYVVDEERHLLGVVSLRDLIVSSPAISIESIYKRDLITVDPEDDQEDVADTMSKYDLLALPVVDESGVILGMVTVDDALDVMDEEAAEDLALATGSTDRLLEVGGLLRWFSRRSLWVWVWAAAGLALAFGVRYLAASRSAVSATAIIAVAIAGLSLPIVLRASEEIASRTVAELIDEPDEPMPVWRRVGGDLLSGLVLGVAVAVAVSAVLMIGFGVPSTTGQLVEFSAGLGLLAGGSVLLTTLVGAVIGAWAHRAAGAGKTVSSTPVMVGVMVSAAVFYLAGTALLYTIVLSASA